MKSEDYPFQPLFQRQLLAILIQLPETYSKYNGIWSYSYFDDPNHRLISRAYIKIRLLGNEHPTRASMLQELLRGHDHHLVLPLDLQITVKELDDLYATPTENINYSLKSVRDWAQHHALIEAIERSLQYLEGPTPEKIRELIDKALAVGADMTNAGVNLRPFDFSNPSKILMQSREAAIPTGLHTLDRYLKGGIRPGEMLTVVGAPGVFKSGTMLNMGMPALRAPGGKKVTYISLEMPELQVLARYYYRITKLNEESMLSNPTRFDEHFNRQLEKYNGALHIKSFGSATLELSHLRTYLDHLDHNGHETELLIVDYPQIMAKPDKESDHISTGRLYAGVRAIATDRKIPVIVAAQANRDALKDPENISLAHISATMDIARHSDFIVAIIQTEDERRSNRIRLKLVKNRNEESGVIISAEVDYPLYWLKDLGVWNRPLSQR
jgi:replicative DNA helicase